jgi:polyisoprenoid-binding protein YceI
MEFILHKIVMFTQMKQYLLIPVLLTAWIYSSAQNFTPVDSSSSVKFKVKNLGFNVGGSFSGLQGAITFDPKNLSVCKFDVSVDANSVNTGIDMRDNHLRNDDYFDVKNYPRIKIVSTKITPSTKSGVLYFFGNLTIKNTTKEISFPFTANPQNGGYIFNGEFKINRRDFNVGGGSTISDNLTVTLEVATKKN